MNWTPEVASSEQAAERSELGVEASDLATEVHAANQRSSLLSKMDRAANILRYYRKSQLLRRAISVGLPFLGSRTIAPLPSHEAINVHSNSLAKLSEILDTREVRTQQGVDELHEQLSNGSFTLLNQTQDLGTPIDWLATKRTHPSRLWSFQLHYQEYLLDLAAGDSPTRARCWETIWDLVADWISANPPETSSLTADAWHPYCISRRLPVWAQLLAASAPPDRLANALLSSFACQARALSQHLEVDLGGNHLLENLRALAFAGALLEGDRSGGWLKLAEQHLRTELERQILPHGEHYERSPKYHCQVLGNLLQIMHLTGDVAPQVHEICRPFAVRMLEFLRFIVHLDGEIPLLGDSCFGEAHSVAEIERLAHLVALSSTTASKQDVTVVDRYWKWQRGGDSLLFDAGPVGADELPAHAHCDLLGFEASIDGRRCFVDSGLFDYDDNLMRSYCRSSAAHNVVTVDLENQCDVWSRFRMGRRARPRTFESGQHDGFSWCQASHDGYRHLGVRDLARLMLADDGGTIACLEHAGSSDGRPLVGRLHLAPEVEATSVGDTTILLTVGNSQRWLFFTPEVILKIVEGWYCDRFGQRTRTQVICYSPAGSDGSQQPFGWALSAEPDTRLTVKADERRCYQVELATQGTSNTFVATFPD